MLGCTAAGTNPLDRSSKGSMIHLLTTYNDLPLLQTKESGTESGESLVDKTLTICSGSDFVNHTWTTFVFSQAGRAQVSIIPESNEHLYNSL